MKLSEPLPCVGIYRENDLRENGTIELTVLSLLWIVFDSETLPTLLFLPSLLLEDWGKEEWLSYQRINGLEPL